MRTIKQLLKEEKWVFFKFSTNAVCYRFLIDAQSEGLTFWGKTEPCSLGAMDMAVLLPGGYLSSVRQPGRIAYTQAGDRVIRIDYEKYVNGDPDCFILP